MGTWGNGNLESDGAQDTLAEICDGLFTRVIELLQHPRAHEYDDEEIDELFVKIEMLFAMSDRGMVNSAPDPKVLEPLFEPYLQRWADYHRRVGQGILVNRDKLIRDSFHRLLKIAEGSSGSSLLHRLDMISKIMSTPKDSRGSGTLSE